MSLSAAAVMGATSAGLFSAACSAAKDLLSKGLSFRIDGMASTFASFAFALPYYAVVLLAMHGLGLSKLEFSETFVIFVLARAVTDTLAEGLKMYAFSHGDISVVTTIFSMSPLFLVMIAPWVTGESLSWLGVGAVSLVTLGGLLLVYRPSSTSWTSQRKAIGLAAAASVFFALNTCFDSLAMKGNQPVAGDVWSPAVGGFAMTLVSATLIAPLALFRRDRRESLRKHQAGLWARGFLEATFMVAKLYAIQFMEGQYVMGLMRLSVVFSIIGGWLFFKEGDFARRMAAGLLIVAGVLLIPWLKSWEVPPPPPTDTPSATSTLDRGVRALCGNNSWPVAEFARIRASAIAPKSGDFGYARRSGHTARPSRNPIECLPANHAAPRNQPKRNERLFEAVGFTAISRGPRSAPPVMVPQVAASRRDASALAPLPGCKDRALLLPGGALRDRRLMAGNPLGWGLGFQGAMPLV